MARVVEEWKLRRNSQLAKENVERHNQKDQTEWQCRFAARHLGLPEEQWADLKPLLIAIEEGRLYSVDAYEMTPEEQASWREYMSTR